MFKDGEEKEKKVEDSSLIDIYTCLDCSGKYYLGSDNENSECVICHSKNIKKESIYYNKKEKIIPFVKNSRDALKEYRKRLRKNPFIPLEFRKKSNISRIEKIFIPSLLTNVSVEGGVKILAGDREDVIKDKQHFTETKKYRVEDTVKINYNNIISNTNTIIDEDKLLMVCKYDYRFIEDYNDNLVDKSKVLIENMELLEKASKLREKIKNHSLSLVKDNVRHQLLKTDENNLIVEFHDSLELLVPVYYLKIKYKNKDYYYIMNGQNGNSILDNCISVVSIIIIGVIIFTLIFIITFLVAYFL